MRISLRWFAPALAAILAAALVVAWLNASGRATSARLSASTTAPGMRAVCAAPRPGQFGCMSIVNTAFRPHALAPNASPPGWGPVGLKAAYNLTSLTAGSGRTVAIVDAYDDPNAASDLAAYRAQYGLPACGSGCFRKLNQNGQASPLPAASGTTGWATEESLDMDMVSAICPYCKIVLLEANSASPTDLGTAVNSAVALGAKYVSNSYGGPEQAGEPTALNHFFNHPGVAITFSSGDSGYGVQYPASSRYVTAVGGTRLRKTPTTARGWTETVWSGAGSGCSKYSGHPSWQPLMSGCTTKRINNDVAATADPAYGVAMYDTYDQGGWLEVGGTSVAAPIIAAVYARSSTPKASTYPASYPYRHRAYLWDVTSGSNGSCSPAYLCHGEKGYDAPTGVGTPHSAAAFKY